MTAPAACLAARTALYAIWVGSIVYVCSHEVVLAVAISAICAAWYAVGTVCLLIINDPYRSVRCLIQAESEMALLRAL